MQLEDLPKNVQDAIAEIASKKGFTDFTIETKPLAGAGENAYGLVLQTKISSLSKGTNPFYCVIKIAPTNSARRIHMRVADYYQREVFMYNRVFKAFEQLQTDEKLPLEKAFNVVPEMYFSSLKDLGEFIIFEDLAQKGFIQNSRKNLPTFELTVSAFKALAKYHAMSFALQEKRSNVFKELISEIRYKDNLYIPTMDQVTIQFAKKYVCRTKSMILEEYRPNQAELLKILQTFEDDFKEIALKAVNGGECEPFSVICHGDFWNNNILYSYDEKGNPTVAKLIDFQMSRYASPVLDIVHYLFACTEKDLRDAHFTEFIQVYHDSLSSHLNLFHLDVEQIYPRAVLDSHLRIYGSYGFCMAILSIPFFISDPSDIPDLDEVAEVIHEISPGGSDSEDKCMTSKNNTLEIEKKSRVLVEEYELLNEKTLPTFKRRMTGIVLDLIKYKMEKGNPTVAKLIDFQMSRYASPVLDIVHYLFACTEKDLRDAHFTEFIQVYHDSLSSHLNLFHLDVEQIYPRAVLDSHLRIYGSYGFCMAILSIPFFISDPSDIPDLDEVAEVIHEISPGGSDSEDKCMTSKNNTLEIEKKSRVLVEEYELLNEKTLPTFKRRMTGIVLDLIKYKMVNGL